MKKNIRKGLEFLVNQIIIEANPILEEAVYEAELNYQKPSSTNKNYYETIKPGFPPSDYEVECEIPGRSFVKLIDDIAKKTLKLHHKKLLLLLIKKDKLTQEEAEFLLKTLKEGYFLEKY